MLDKLTRDDFAAHLEQSFRLRDGDSRLIELTLIEVSPIAGSGPAGGREPFSIVLRGPAQESLAQGTYAVEIPTLGELALFIVPIGPDAEGMRYEAVFN